jgi:AraC-like DNA-binding protein
VEERLEALKEPWTSFVIEFPAYPKVLSHGREESPRVLFMCPQAEASPRELCLALFGNQVAMHSVDGNAAPGDLPGTRFIFIYSAEPPEALPAGLGAIQERIEAPVLVTQKSNLVVSAGYVNEVLRRAIEPTSGNSVRPWGAPRDGGDSNEIGKRVESGEAEIWRDPLPEIRLVDDEGNKIGANLQLQDYRVEYACRYVLAHFRENINRDSMAEMVGLSPGYFSNLFRGEVGMSFSDYLIQVRIENAKILLRRFDLSVEAVSRQCGFHSLAHFSRTFKDRVGLSPLKYRKSPQAGDA